MSARVYQLAAVVCCLASCLTAAIAFHLSFGHRLPLKSVNSPQLNPESHLIRPVECRNANNNSEAGICMFSIDCMQNKGVPLSVCKHKYFVGTCCRLPDYNNFVGIVYDLRETETNHVLEAREVPPTTATPRASATAQPAAQPAPAHSEADHSRPTASEATTDPIDARYKISSASLFQAATAAAAPNTTPAPTNTLESARSAAAGPLEPQLTISDNKTQLQAEPAGDGSRLAASGSSEQQQQQKILEVLDLEVLSTMKSVHSAPSSLSSIKPPAPNQQQLKSSIYGLHLGPQASGQPMDVYEMSSAPTTLALSASTTTAAPLKTTTTPPASELNPSSRGPAAAAAASASSTISDQEFTLSTSAAAQSQPTSDRPAASAGELGAASAAGSQSASSDLVSAADGQPTTTPFTVSLSTALLPNMSASSSLAPTSQPPATVLVSFRPQLQSQSPITSSSPALASASQPVGSSTPPSHAAELATFSQLYSNQHSSPAAPAPTSSSAPSSSSDQTQHHHRPSLHSSLQAASKIVAGSSSSNNLIPGLSNLQSAILSHIPFKIATNLSNYLQAAMKPAGSRPLISSNTAPHLQYQQQQQQQQQLVANSSRPTSAPASTHPTASAATLAHSSIPQAAPSVIRFPATDNDLAASSLPSPPAAAYDVVRESQRVCGRPQVQQQSQPQPMAEGAHKRMARIVGGNQSAFGQWPWMVSLRQWRKGAFLHKCGAALLNENWAITAAHCVEDVKVTDLLLRLGEFDVSNQEEPYPFVERRVRLVKSHPLFNPKTFEYDLALLKFAEPIKYERNIVPVCVPSGNDTYIDRMATVIGWGRLYEDGPLPDVIQHVDVPIITNNECERMYKNAGYIEEIPDMFICAGISKGGRDSCEGDSGGPLTMVDHDGRSYLVGIISWGIGCALPSQPGVYTRITAFSGWINELAGS